MYSEKIEGIIEAILNVGELDESQLAVLKRAAENEGENPEELEIVVKGRLAKMKKAAAGPANLPNAKHGNVLKCPSCGAQVVGGTAVCPECGYTFSNIESNSSIEKLNALIREEEQRTHERICDLEKRFKGGELKELVHKADMDGFDKVCQIISSFPVPNTRNDLLEFLTAIKTPAEEGVYDYRNLYYSCVNKARLSFADDKDFAPYFEAEEEMKNKPSGCLGIILFIPIVAILLTSLL